MRDCSRFRPDPSLSRAEMERLQREVADAAVFEDDCAVTPEDVRDGETLVAGVDQAFLTNEPSLPSGSKPKNGSEHGERHANQRPARAVSAVVVLRGEEVIERTHAVTELSIPYVPGLLAFREGGPILAALDELDADPDLYLFDGSGRIHFREAGLATHVGVIRDTPSVGVAKRLLCGTPRSSVDGLSEGERVPVDADDSMITTEGTVVGYAYQSRQYPNSRRINPLYVSPGHRVSAETATAFVAACGGEYKLPEPTRLADAYADEVKRRVGDGNA